MFHFRQCSCLKKKNPIAIYIDTKLTGARTKIKIHQAGQPDDMFRFLHVQASYYFSCP
jgi:hypothetical protein